MRIVDIRELSVPISRYADPSVPSGGLTTSVVAVITDVSRDGKPIVGYGFASIGRFAQGGLIRERFAPRLLAARDIDLMDDKCGGLPRSYRSQWRQRVAELG
jgi:D(-)-tartrate dehydratase